MNSLKELSKVIPAQGKVKFETVLKECGIKVTTENIRHIKPSLWAILGRSGQSIGVLSRLTGIEKTSLKYARTFKAGVVGQSVKIALEKYGQSNIDFSSFLEKQKQIAEEKPFRYSGKSQKAGKSLDFIQYRSIK